MATKKKAPKKKESAAKSIGRKVKKSFEKDVLPNLVPGAGTVRKIKKLAQVVRGSKSKKANPLGATITDAGSGKVTVVGAGVKGFGKKEAAALNKKLQLKNDKKMVKRLKENRERDRPKGLSKADRATAKKAADRKFPKK